MNTKVYKTNISPKFRKDNSASEIVDAMHFSTDNNYNLRERKTEQFIYQQDNQRNINNRADKEINIMKDEGRTYEFCYVNNDNPNTHENRPFLKSLLTTKTILSIFWSILGHNEASCALRNWPE